MGTVPITRKNLLQHLGEILLEDEKLLWSCEDCSASALNKVLNWFGMVFLAVWTFLVLTPGIPFSALVSASFGQLGKFSLIFVVCFIIMSSIHIVALIRSNRFAYAVTNRRILVLNSGIVVTCDTIWQSQIQYVTTSESKGHGTVYLRQPPLFSRKLFGQTKALVHPANNLENVPEPEIAAGFIRKHLLPIKTDVLKEKEERKAKARAARPKDQGLFKPMDWE